MGLRWKQGGLSRLRCGGIVALLLAVIQGAHAQQPFSAAASVVRDDGSNAVVSVALTIPQKHYLYADQVTVSAAEGVALDEQTIPEPTALFDELQGKDVPVYEQDVTLKYGLPEDVTFPVELTVSYQGCSKEPMICFMPVTETIAVSPAGEESSATEAPAPSDSPPESSFDPQASSWETLVKNFTVAGTTSGYLRSGAFLDFLQAAERGETADNLLDKALREHGALVLLALILLGGLALNLTPCVLPMIPINIAIIGAGAQAGSRARGFALGAVYGLGIAVVYGALGLIVVLTGTQFGSLNASPWFNLGIAILFIVMALAMFGVINIDFSRLQGSGNTSGKRGGFVTAFAFGCVAALLAGACVAPVVIAVLLLSADLAARGHNAGLLLPFLLGLGMALPWPFAGAGLSFLPKPGKWMEKVKIGFGIFILLFALWYGRLGVSLLTARAESAGAQPAAESAEDSAPHTSLVDALRDAQQEQKPVFIDFWASWCKNCLHMEETTFKDPDVRAALDDYVVLKFRAEDMTAPGISEVLDHFDVIGLPTYIVLKPR